MRAVIFANGEIRDYGFINKNIRSEDFIICCDGGLWHAHSLGLIPGVIVGDMDSAPEELLDGYRKMNVRQLTHPARKDYTDLELGISFACDNGADEIIVFGAGGGRPDHAMANAHVLMQALRKGVPARLVDESCTVYITDGFIEMNGRKGDIISLLPLTTEVKGVITQGLSYPLKDEILYAGYARGISNVMETDTAGVKVAEGVLLVFHICSFFSSATTP